MKYEVKIPAVGESITEAVIGQWMKKSGEFVKANEVLLSVETDKASVEVVAEQQGVLTIAVEQGKTVPIGTVVAMIDSDGKPTVASPAATEKKPAAPSATNPTAPAPLAEVRASALPLSPAVQKIVTEKQLDPNSITGTGRGGRLTKGDVLSATLSSPITGSETRPATVSSSAPAIKEKTVITRGSGRQGDEKRVPMTTIRKKIAERLVQAQHTAAILTTFNEIDMTNVMQLRNRYKDRFKEKYGVSLGFMGFFIKASIEALKDWPMVNAQIEGTDIVYKNYYNISVAVGTDKGLIVPVIKDADTMSVAQIELTIKEFANKARDGKITIDDLSGGTFTISNGGVYGSLMSTPILNPPQVGILGMHKIEERPMAINGKVEIRPMMYVALSYDHRIIDGKEAVSFLVRIKECVEDPERLVLEI
jgi:2-oxoglutarate dehydrogenase E2 component (dihydrolipoamide succinyltransferase)